MGIPLNHPFLIGFSPINHPAIGATPIYGNPQIDKYIYGNKSCDLFPTSHADGTRVLLLFPQFLIISIIYHVLNGFIVFSMEPNNLLNIGEKKSDIDSFHLAESCFWPFNLNPIILATKPWLEK